MTEPSREQLYLEIGKLIQSVNALHEEQILLRQDISSLKAQANKWKGAFGVVILGGGFLGWIGSLVWDHFIFK